MKPTQTLDQANKYLMSIADALYQLSSRFDISKMDRLALEKYSGDVFAISKALEDMKNNMLSSREMKQKAEDDERSKFEEQRQKRFEKIKSKEK